MLNRLSKSGFWIILIFFLIAVIFFWKFFLFKSIPIPADLLVGSYYPWLGKSWDHLSRVPVKNPLMSDIVSLTYPWRKIVVDNLKLGQLPLWNPDEFWGVSLIGNFQAAIFNPFNLLFFLPFSFNFTWGLLVVIQPFLAFISMYLLLKYWKLPYPSILLGSLSYGLSAPMLVWMEYNVHGFSIATFPLIIYLLERYINEQKIWLFILISLLLAYVVFVGYPQNLYYYLLFSFIYFLGKLIFFKHKKNFVVKSLLFYILSIILGLGLAAIQLIPGIESLYYSIRSVDSAASVNLVTYLPFKNLIMGLVPDYFGNPATYNYFGLGNYESFAFYTSLVALTVAPLALKNSRRKIVVYPLLIFVSISILLSVKSYLSVFVQTLSSLGLKGSIGTRVLFIYSFAISCLGAIGLENLLKDKKKFSHLEWIIPLTLGVIGGVGLKNFLNNHSQESLITLRNIFWPVSITCLTLVLVSLFRKWHIKFIPYLLAGLLIIDMFRFGWKYLPFTKEELISPQINSLKFLENQNKPFRIGIERGEVLPPNSWDLYNLESVSGYNIFLPLQSAKFISFLNHGNVNQEISRFVTITNFGSSLIDLVNTRFVLAILRDKNGEVDPQGQPPYYIKSKKYKVVYQDGPMVILENSDVFPRAFSVSSYLVNPDLESSLKLLSSNSFDLHTKAILDNDPKLKNLSSCQVNLAHYSGQKLNITSKCSGDSIMVVSNSFHPGWKAWVDNQRVKVYQADGNFLAITLPPGQTKIRLEFLPKSFEIGLDVTLASLIILLIISIFSYAIKKREVIY